LTRFGWPQVVVYPAAIFVLFVLSLVWALTHPAPLPWLAAALLAGLLVWTLAFFRDPQRTIPTDPAVLLAPADGKIIDIHRVQETTFINGPALRITIFLSIFDVHINRAPCNVTVEAITYKPGKFKNAMKPAAARVNESNDLMLIRTDPPHDRLILRQISGAVARRIVCTAKPNETLTAGQRFGMIKFGSGTELYVPARENLKCLVKIGDKVKAGLSPVVRYL